MDELATRTETELTTTIDGTLDRYAATLDVLPRTRENYRKAAGHFIAWMQDNGIVNPKRADVLAYRDELKDRYSPATVSAYMTATRSLFTYLEAEGVYPNIAANVKGAKSGHGFKKDALSVEQARRILAVIDRDTLTGKRDYAIVNLLLHTGLRTIEVVRADIGDMRAETGATVLYVQGKGHEEKDSFVKLTPAAVDPIRAYLKARGAYTSDAPLFAAAGNRNGGGRMTTRSISRICKGALVAADMDDPRLTAHSFRHTAVTLSLIGGATVQEAQAMARHASINTTMIYAHNLDRIDNAAEDKIDALLEA